MAQWIDSNGAYHNTDNLSYGDQGDQGRANSPAVSAQIQADKAAGGNQIDYRLGAGSGNWDRSTNNYFSGDQGNPSDWLGNPSNYASGGGNVQIDQNGNPIPGTGAGAGGFGAPAGGKAGVTNGAGPSVNPLDAWKPFLDPGAPSAWGIGWGNMMQNAGIDPLVDNPYNAYMANKNTYMPQLLRYIANLGMGGGPEQNIQDVQNNFRNFAAGNINQGQPTGADMLARIKAMSSSFTPQGGKGLTGQAGAFNTAMQDNSTAADYIGAMRGSGMSSAQQAANQAYMDRLMSQFQMDTAGGRGNNENFAQWFSR